MKRRRAPEVDTSVGSRGHYDVSTFAMAKGVEDFGKGAWRPGLAPCCGCNQCRSAYVSGWALAKNESMRPPKQEGDYNE